MCELQRNHPCKIGGNSWSRQLVQHYRGWGAGYVTRSASVKVVPRAIYKGTKTVVNSISNMIKSAGFPIHCNNMGPPRYKLGGKWYCSYPELRECHDPTMLPVDVVHIESFGWVTLAGEGAFTLRNSWMSCSVPRQLWYKESLLGRSDPPWEKF
jgi:hypothetical protein